MSSIPKLAAIFAILSLVCLAATWKVGAEEMVICNGATFAAGSARARSAAFVLNDLVQNTNRYYTYNNQSPGTAGKVYGHASCNHGINAGDCTNCLSAARQIIANRCGRSIGAQVKLDQNCFIRYEIYRFALLEEAVEALDLAI